MYSLFVPDEIAHSYSNFHSILNFINDNVKLQKFSNINKSTHAVLYINEYTTYDRYDQYIKRANTAKIIIDYSYESGMGDEWLEKILSHYMSLGIPLHSVLFVLNTSASVNKKLEKVNVCFFDFFAADAVRRLKYDSFARLKIHQRPRRLNLLVAKLKKVSRFLTVYAFYKKNLLDSSILSILCDHEDIEIHKTQFPEIEEEFYQEIQKHYGPKYDNLKEENLGRNDVGITYTGWPNDPRIYDRSSVSVVCETSERWTGWTPEFITEKTYRPIMNRHPFVIQGSPGILQYLRSIEYRTFESVIDESYDKSTEISYKVVDQITEAAIDLVKQTTKSAPLIQEIVDHNYNKLIEIGSNDIKNLSDRILEFLGENGKADHERG